MLVQEAALQDIIQKGHINYRMAKRDSRTIRVKVCFIEDILDKIVENEKKRGRDDTKYPAASKILRDKIIKAGGIK